MASTLTLNARRETETVTGTDLMDICDRIRALSETFQNYDTLREAAALNAHQEGRAAWWIAGTYHNQSLVNVGHYANTHSLGAALDAFADDTYPSPSRHRVYLLERTIPLNERAKAEKAAAVAADVARGDRS